MSRLSHIIVALPADTPRRRHVAPARWRLPFTLKLLLISILIPSLGTGLWQLREPVLRNYYLYGLRQAYRADDLEAVPQYVEGILQLAPATRLAAFTEIESWPEAFRTDIANMLRIYYTQRIDRPGQHPISPSDPLLDVPLRLAPQDEEVILFTAEMAAGIRQNYRRAALLLDSLITLRKAKDSDGNYGEYRQLGGYYERISNYEKALICYELAQRMRPRDPTSQLPVIGILARLGRYEEALTIISQQLATSSDTGTYRGWRVYLLGERARFLGLIGHNKAALADLRAARWMAQSGLISNNVASVGGLESIRRQILLDMGRRDEVVKSLSANADADAASHGGRMSSLIERANALEEAGRYGEAIRAYREALLVARGHSLMVLYNNLAWFLATTKDKRFRDPREALRLARIAAKLDGYSSPFLLDTLAEAAYINGLYDEAVKWERLALTKGGDFYRPSVKRFERAAAAAKAGRTITRTDTTLRDQNKFPVKINPAFRLVSLPRGSRFAEMTYKEIISLKARAGRRQRLPLAWWGNPEGMLQQLAQVWVACPPTASEQPRADFQAMLSAIVGHSSVSRRRAMLPRSERVTRVRLLRFLYGIHIAGRVSRWMGSMSAEGAGKVNDRSVILGMRVGGLCKKFSDAEIRTLLTHLASGKFLLSECLLILQRPLGTAATPSRITRRVFEARWQLIAARLRLVASGKPFVVAEPSSTRSATTSPRVRQPPRAQPYSGLTPPPKD